MCKSDVLHCKREFCSMSKSTGFVMQPKKLGCIEIHHVKLNWQLRVFSKQSNRGFLSSASGEGLRAFEIT